MDWGEALTDLTALAEVMDVIPVEVLLVEVGDDGLICRAANRRAATARDSSVDALVDRPLVPLCTAPAHRHLPATVRDAVKSMRPAHSYVVYDATDGRRCMAHSYAVPLLGAGDIRFALAVSDADDRSPSGLLPTDLASALDAAPDIVVRYDRDLQLLYCNRAAERMFARPRAELVHRTNRELGLPAAVADRWDSALQTVLGTGQSEQFEYALDGAEEKRWYHARLAPERDGSARVTSVIATCRDVTEQRLLADSLVHLAMHDPVTQLPNRRLLLDRLHPASARAKRTGRRLALLFVDLDDFKCVNDTLGHRAGDEVLRAAAERIANASRTEDTIVRFGGDEFVILCEDLERPDDAFRIADRITTAMASPFRTAGAAITIRASIGVAVGGQHHSADELLHEADRLMYRDKSGRRQARVVPEG
jgi:diguanylate cyclase (GGDEF)-like protein/PAS domain S-box-containing protein